MFLRIFVEESSCFVFSSVFLRVKYFQNLVTIRQMSIPVSRVQNFGAIVWDYLVCAIGVLWFLRLFNQNYDNWLQSVSDQHSTSERKLHALLQYFITIPEC